MKNIIYFDGVCNLCNWAVQFVIKRDKNEFFSFSSLQSDYAKATLKHGNGQYIKFDTVVFQHGDQIYTRSDAALEILRHIDGGWKWLHILKVFPRKMRDAVYDYIATNRYRWFGKKESCMVPTPELQARFLS